MVALLAVLTSAVARSFCTSFDTGYSASASIVICGPGAAVSLDEARLMPDRQSEAPVGGVSHCEMCTAAAPMIIADPVRTAGDVTYPEAISPKRVLHEAPAHRHLPGIAIIRGPPTSA